MPYGLQVRMAGNPVIRILEWVRARSSRPTRVLKGRGMEFGAHEIPIPGIRPIYLDRFAMFAHKACRADVLADAHRLPFPTGALNYVATSHVLEHLPNPGRALAEWYRVVRPGGWIYLVVPDRRYTFDAPRSCTPVPHLLDDFVRGTDASDKTHIDDYVKRDLTRCAPGVPECEWPAVRERMRKEIEEEIDCGHVLGIIHYHVFEPYNLSEFVEELKVYPGAALDWEVVRIEERYPPGRGDGILLLIRVRKRNSARELTA